MKTKINEETEPNKPDPSVVSTDTKKAGGGGESKSIQGDIPAAPTDAKTKKPKRAGGTAESKGI
ncbi:MAG: hypothetical protein WBV94_12660 [Blastocatellia bacterium]